MKLTVFTILLCLSFCVPALGQDTSGEEIKLSGVVIRMDSLKPIPFTTIHIKNKQLGTRSNHLGLFSLTVHPADTIVFSAIGSKTMVFIVPDTLHKKSYSIIQRMPRDTIALHEIEISSWPSLNEFNSAFTRDHGFDAQIGQAFMNANPNIAPIGQTPIRDAEANYQIEGLRWANRYSNLYENAHIPVNHVLNPKHWDKLFKDWKQ